MRRLYLDRRTPTDKKPKGSMKTPRVSPATPAPVTPAPSAQPIRGDISISEGIACKSIIVQAFDLEGIPQERREIGLAYYDQNEIDRFGAWWRALMAKRAARQAPKLTLLP